MNDAIEQQAVKVLPDGRMDRPNAARYIGVSVQTLAVWSMRRVGPPPIRVGGKIFYAKADVDAFIEGGKAA